MLIQMFFFQMKLFSNLNNAFSLSKWVIKAQS